MDLLGGRLLVTMPSHAKVEPRGRNIMSADAPPENETRVVLDEGQERLVLLANDLFAIAGDDFLASVKAELARRGDAKGHDAAVATAGRGLSAVAITPKALDNSSEAVLVESYYLATSDGLVELVSVYVNPAAAADPRGSKVLADKILGSLAAGTRTLAHAGGNTKVVSLDGTRDLHADLPKDVVVSLQPGPDFDVARLHPLRRLGKDEGSLGIYVGHYPSFEKDAKANTQADRVLGRDVQWQLGEREGGEVRLAHQLGGAPTGYCSRSSTEPVTHSLSSLAR